MQPTYGPEGWKTIRYAIRGWGSTLRLIAVLVSLPMVGVLVSLAIWFLKN